MEIKILDKTLVKAIKVAVGDGSREAKFALLAKIDAAAKDMSTPKIRERFNEMVVKHGRAVTAICVAATIFERRYRLDDWRIDWATAVLELWTTKPASGVIRAYIRDDLHPTRICEYADSFIRLTSEY